MYLHRYKHLENPGLGAITGQAGWVWSRRASGE